MIAGYHSKIKIKVMLLQNFIINGSNIFLIAVLSFSKKNFTSVTLTMLRWHLNVGSQMITKPMNHHINQQIAINQILLAVIGLTTWENSW